MIRLGTVLLCLMPMFAMAQDARRGRQLTQAWCAACHKLGQPDGPARIGGAPTFIAIAANPATTPASLRRYLSSEHARMPAFPVSEDQDDVIAYIVSLQK
jgi:mono/diheme cytochrome c family protein